MSMKLLLSDIAKFLGCELPVTSAVVTGIVIDSRKVTKGNLFVALVGEHVDGHQYLAQARQAGACAALVSVRQQDELPQLLVDDVVDAFGKIAAYWRQQCNAGVVAITGSNGKTTVKEMVAAILRQCGAVLATQGNLNNELGVPLTLSRLDKSDDFAVIEMGANHSGEIARLTAMTSPNVAIINNVAPAHLEGFGSIEGVAKAKGEIFGGLTDDGIGIINADMDFADYWIDLLTSKNKPYIGFGLNNSAEITANDIQLDPASSHFMVELDNEFHYINLPMPGIHNVANALAAIAVAKALRIPAKAMVKGLASMKGVPHRLQLRSGINHSQIIDDSYNANPGSYSQALAALKAFSGEHWVVLGDFGELGDISKEIHKQLGKNSKEQGIKRLLTIGTESKYASEQFGTGATHFNDMAVLQKYLETALTSEVTVLIKGSRYMHLDKLADALAELGEN